ncbi:MAG: hypothetical protein H7174_03515 [Flavobacterium sp.]|nr:hypothetical protein [Flavobacterium sp.]
MKKKIKIVSIIVLVAIIVCTTYSYLLFGGERNLNSEKPAFIVTSKKINQEFVTNIDSANAKYLEKAIAISGVVTSIKNHELIIDNTIICSLKNTDNSIKVDQNITVKGRVVGYDDLMSELRLDQCFVNN